jgi:curved DNA-binding protein
MFLRVIRTMRYYQVLEVQPSASQREIKLNYLRLAKVYHPDLYKGKNKARFGEIQEAFETLRKPALRN